MIPAGIMSQAVQRINTHRSLVPEVTPGHPFETKRALIVAGHCDVRAGLASVQDGKEDIMPEVWVYAFHHTTPSLMTDEERAATDTTVGWPDIIASTASNELGMPVWKWSLLRDDQPITLVYFSTNWQEAMARYRTVLTDNWRSMIPARRDHIIHSEVMFDKIEDILQRSLATPKPYTGSIELAHAVMQKVRQADHFSDFVDELMAVIDGYVQNYKGPVADIEKVLDATPEQLCLAAWLTVRSDDFRDPRDTDPDTEASDADIARG